MSGDYTFESLTDEPSLAGVGAAWDGLVRAMPRPSPFLLHGWVLEWWRHYCDGLELATEVAYRDGRLVAVLPMVIRRRGPIRVAEFLGSSESALADLLLEPGEDALLGRRLLERLARRKPDVVDLFGLPANSRLSAAADRGIRVVRRADAPVLNLTSPWPAVYRQKTTTRDRNHNSRRRKQLERLGQLEITLAREGPALDLALEDALRLHGARWAGRPDGSSFGTVEGAAFHRAALRRLSPIDVARIITLKLDGKPIAFNYYFVLCGRMYGHRQAFDPQFARFSPGMVCTLAAIEAASAEGVTRVEFLGGRERYKLQLADEFDPIYQAIGLTSTVRGRAAAIAKIGLIALRRRFAESSSLRDFYYEGLGPARTRALRLVHRVKAPPARPS
jgi:CelD/BcsL family acetyltransferase involved in cellulose biosynthesis